MMPNLILESGLIISRHRHLIYFTSDVAKAHLKVGVFLWYKLRIYLFSIYCLYNVYLNMNVQNP